MHIPFNNKAFWRRFFNLGNKQFGKFWFKQYCILNLNGQFVLNFGEYHANLPAVEVLGGIIKEDRHSLWCSYLLAILKNSKFSMLWYAFLKMWNLNGKENAVGLGREGTKGIFDALRKWFYLFCYWFHIKTAHRVIIPFNKILLGLYCKSKLMFCILFNLI